MSDDPAPKQPRARTRWSAVLAFGLATLLVASESSLAAFALPLVGAEFGVGATTTAWVVLAYALPLAALAIPAGRWVDQADLRAVFALSLAGVGAAGALAALAPTLWALLAARAVQGVASALYLAVYLPVVADAVRAEQRGRAMSLIQTVMMIGSIAVAPVGGVVAEAFGWRAVFVFKLPLLAALLWWGWRAIPPRRAAGPRLPAPAASALTDAVVLGGAVGLGLLAVERIGGAWPISLALGIAAAAGGAVWLRLPAAAPVVALVRRPAFGAAAAALVLVAALSGLTIVSLPYFVSEVMGRSPEVLGVAMMLFTAAAAALSPLGGLLADRFTPLAVARLGSALTALALLTMLGLDAGSGLYSLSWRMALVGAAMALFMAPVMTALLGAAPVGEEGTAGGVANLARTLGNTVGPAIAALAWAMAGSGEAGLRAGVWALAGCALAAFAVLLIARRPPMPTPAAVAGGYDRPS
ncbi:MFS transporter [Streptomonospora salina]|uniref:Putative MFS family arabinose efflux permease n=1 Tax=Streptomonospora salina TaxID=104205 RepID=A0A841E0G7_9ACTN|nr:MFS transporter [Streptomonospora salina]MBB5996546.1 putative MFS family arabinose efflux permease [Streptomonospora salina]